MISLFTNICANDSEEKNSDVKVKSIEKQSNDFSLNLQITDFIPNIHNINIFNHINGISPQTFPSSNNYIIKNIKENNDLNLNNNLNKKNSNRKLIKKASNSNNNNNNINININYNNNNNINNNNINLNNYNNINSNNNNINNNTNNNIITSNINSNNNYLNSTNKISNIIPNHRGSKSCYSYSIRTNNSNGTNSNDNYSVKVFSNLINRNNQEITEEDNLKNNKIILSDYEDSNFFKNDVVVINASGYKKSLRGKNDGYTFFGTVKENNGMIINDYIINNELGLIKEKRLFVIFFNKKNEKFYFRSINDKEEKKNSQFIYLKLSVNPLIINNKMKKYFQIGDIIFKTEINDNNQIHIILHLNIGKKTLYFNSNQKKIITFGRDNLSTVKLNENMISKIHCTIEFKNNNWVIYDGNGKKPSTNGTWMFCNEKFELNDEINYAKIGKSIIQIKKM